MATWYGIASIAFGAVLLASGVYALLVQRKPKTFALGVLAAAILVAFGIWMLGQ